MPRIDVIPKNFRTGLHIKCPVCEQDLRIVYLLENKLVCDSCEKVFEIFINKSSKINYEDIVEHGWGLDNVKD